MRPLSPLLALLVGGCTWISSADLEGRRTTMDDDGDGFVKSQDCDDADAKINPDAEEIWYDGIDSDCGQDDDFDADKDGYIADEYVGLPTAGVEASGLLPGGDCDDEDAAVNPEATDVLYDGIDTDCRGNDDYDADGDGFVPDEYANLSTRYVDSSGALPAGDCDDERDDVHPGAADAWYDGVDNDCAGDDDYDADADGYVPDLYVNLTTRYVSGSGTLPGGDCDDSDPVTNPSPTTVDSWYDGWDTDCAGDDDFDQDLDGFVDDANFGRVTEDASGAILGTGALPGGDCDDGNDAVFPGATETISDATDYDCDGSASTFVMAPLEDFSDALYSLDWAAPGDLVFDANADSVYLSVRTPEVVVTRDSASGPLSPSTYYESAFAFGSDRRDPESGIVDIADWWRYTGASAPYSVTEGHDFIAEDDALYGLVGLQLATGRALRMNGYDLSDGSRFGQSSRLTFGGSSVLPDFEDMSLMRDSSGNLHAAACESSQGILHYLRADPATLEANSLVEQELYSGISMQSCELVANGTLLGRGATGLETWGFDITGLPPTFSQTSVNSTSSPLELEVLSRGSSRFTVMADVVSQSIVILDTAGSPDVLTTHGTPRSLHAAFVNGGVGNPDIVVAYANNTGQAWFVRYTTSTGLFTEYQLATGGVQALDVAVFIDTEPTSGDEYVLAAVAGLTDLHFGWGWY